MKTLCLDSAHKYLIIVLYEDGKLVGKVEKLSWKKQSETIFPELVKLMEEARWTPDDIDEVVISDGPGSYTGVRIAMTIAKVFCTRKQKPLYTISTLQLYAGICEDAFVMLDARSNRAYCAIINQGDVKEEMILSLDEIKDLTETTSYHLFGDTDLIEKESETFTFAKNFMDLRKHWQRVDNVHILTPRYLKEQDEYKVK